MNQLRRKGRSKRRNSKLRKSRRKTRVKRQYKRTASRVKRNTYRKNRKRRSTRKMRGGVDSYGTPQQKAKAVEEALADIQRQEQIQELKQKKIDKKREEKLKEEKLKEEIARLSLPLEELIEQLRKRNLSTEGSPYELHHRLYVAKRQQWIDRKKQKEREEKDKEEICIQKCRDGQSR